MTNKITIYLASPRGFCAGVDRAIEIVKKSFLSFFKDGFLVAGTSPKAWMFFPFIFPQFMNKRTQDLPKIYCDAGQFYWGTKTAWLKQKKIFTKKKLKVKNWDIFYIGLA